MRVLLKPRASQYRWSLLAPVLLLAAACAAQKPYSARLLTPNEHNRCAVQGGRVDRVMRGGEACIIPTTDRGKVCDDNSQCQGSCELVSTGKGKSPGQCSKEKGSPVCTLQLVGGIAHPVCKD